jgi:methyl-accepting chemotaxis protein
MNYQTGVAEKSTILDTLIEVAPIFQKLFPLDCNITITDRKCFLAEYSGEDLEHLHQQEGAKISETGGIMKAIESGNIQTSVIPKELYGVPFKSVAIPIKDENGQIIGCLAIAMSLKNQEKLEQATQSLSVTSEEIVASTQELAVSAQELANGMELVDSLRGEMEKHVQRTEKLLVFIKNIAQNSNILGINAAIEAARAGEKGQGFGIIATEIRKMAESSANSVEEIKTITEEIKQKMSQISQEMQKAFQFAQSQAAASQQIAAAIQGLNEFIIDLEGLSKII